MARKLIARLQLLDGSGAWVDTEGYVLISTLLKPEVSNQVFEDADSARAAAGNDLATVTSADQASALWSAQDQTQPPRAVHGLASRRDKAVKRYLQIASVQGGRHFVRKVILCDEVGDLPAVLQPPASFLVMQEGSPVVIDVFENEALAFGSAEQANQAELDQMRVPDAEPPANADRNPQVKPFKHR